MKGFTALMVALLVVGLSGFAVAGEFHGHDWHGEKQRHAPEPPMPPIPGKNHTWWNGHAEKCGLNLSTSNVELLTEYYSLTTSELSSISMMAFFDYLKLNDLKFKMLIQNQSPSDYEKVKAEFERLKTAEKLSREEFAIVSRIMMAENREFLFSSPAVGGSPDLKRVEVEKLKLALKLASSSDGNAKLIGEYLAKTTAMVVETLGLSVDNGTKKLIDVAMGFNVSERNVLSLFKGYPVFVRHPVFWKPLPEPLPLPPVLPLVPRLHNIHFFVPA